MRQSKVESPGRCAEGRVGASSMVSNVLGYIDSGELDVPTGSRRTRHLHLSLTHYPLGASTTRPRPPGTRIERPG